MTIKFATILIPLTFTAATPILLFAENSHGIENSSVESRPIIEVSGPKKKNSSLAGKVFSSVGSLFSMNEDSPLFKAWQQAQIGTGLNLLDKTISISDKASTSLDVKYHYTVQPAFVKNYHQRLDQYSIDFCLADTVANYVGANANMSAQLSFSRVFDNKLNAVEALPYLPNRIPWKADTALNQLKPGEMVRFEVGTGLSAGPVSSIALTSNIPLNASANVNRNSQMVIDIYRMKFKLVRMRMVTIRHLLDLGGSINTDPLGAFNFGQSLIENTLGKLFKINPLSFGGATNMSKKKPVSTFMVDYIFNLEKPEAAQAFEETMSQLHHLKAINFFDFKISHSSIDDRILSLVQAPESLVKRDETLPAGERSVNRIFKGTTEATYHSSFLESKLKILIPIWYKRIDNSNSIAQVRGFDAKNNPIDMLYLARSSISNFKGVAGLWQKLLTNETDALFRANFKDDKVIPTLLSDIVLQKNLSDKNLTKSKYIRATSFIDLTVPTASALIPEVNFKEVNKLVNGYFRLKLVIHPEAIGVMEKLSKNQIHDRLVDLLRRDPFASEINSEHTQTSIGESSESSTTEEKLQEDINDVTNLFAVFLDDHSTMIEKYQAYLKAREFELFEAIGPALMVSLIPKDKIEDMIFLKVSIGGDKLAATSITYGKKDVSDFFSSFQYMQATLNSRDFDMRLDTNVSSQDIRAQLNSSADVIDDITGRATFR